MKEIWKDIPDYEGIYQVSNLGRVRSIDRIDNCNRFKKGKILKIMKYKNTGYCYVCLVKNGKKINNRIHRLVAITFINNLYNSNVVNHIDGDKTNNNVTNLEWCSQSYNIKEAFRIGLSRKHGLKKVVQYDINMNVINLFDSIMDAERKTKISNSKIVACCKKKYGRKTAGGYIWRYYEDSA